MTIARIDVSPTGSRRRRDLNATTPTSPGDLGLRRSLGHLASLVMLAILVSACGGDRAPTGEPPPAHLRVVPCGGAAEIQRPGSSEWVALDTEIIVEEMVPVRAEGDDNARLCLADGSVLELVSNTAAAMRPTEDRSRLLIELQEGQVLLLARQTPYGFTTSACPVQVSDVPARLRVELREGVTHVMVEQGSAVCATGSEPTLLPTCWELVAAPGAEPEVAQYCGLAGDLLPTETAAPTSAPPATATPTPEPSPGATSTPPEATATPEPTPIP